MRPIFTLHAGEYLVGSYLETKFKNVALWVPARDIGIDLLVTDRRRRKALGFQVKFSKDFLVTHRGPEFQQRLRATGWWTIKRTKLAQSVADYWVFVLQGFASRTTDFVVVPRGELLRKIDAIHGRRSIFQLYLTVTADGRCWETRGLKAAEQLSIALGGSSQPKRDLTRWLNNWKPVSQLNR